MAVLDGLDTDYGSGKDQGAVGVLSSLWHLDLFSFHSRRADFRASKLIRRIDSNLL